MSSLIVELLRRLSSVLMVVQAFTDTSTSGPDVPRGEDRDPEGSETPADRHTFAFAGYVASAEQWERFDPLWKQRVMAEGLNQFHATDVMYNATHEVDGWSLPRAQTLFDDLIAIVNDTTRGGRGYLVSLRTIEKSWVPFIVCLHRYLLLVFQDASLLGQKDTLGLVWDSETKANHKACQYLRAVKQSPDAAACGFNRLTTWTAVAQKDVVSSDGFVGEPALQAADLAAYTLMTGWHEHREPPLTDQQVLGPRGDQFSATWLDPVPYEAVATLVLDRRFAWLPYG